jgi:hypothetical protein
MKGIGSIVSKLGIYMYIYIGTQNLMAQTWYYKPNLTCVALLESSMEQSFLSYANVHHI